MTSPILPASEFNLASPLPGRYADLGIREYHSSAGVSRSTLLRLENGTPKSCRYYMETPTVETDAMRLGSAVDMLVFEPHRASSELAVRPKFGRSKTAIEEAAAWDEEHAGRLVLTEAQADKAHALSSAVLNARSVRGLMSDAMAQESLYWRQEGILAKCRPDGYDEARATTFDLKTAHSLSDRHLATATVDYGYDVQAAMNANACAALGLPWAAHVLVWVEKSPPYDVRCTVFTAEDGWMEFGEARMLKLLRRFDACQQSGKWPGHDNGVAALPMPKWVSIKLEEEQEAERASRREGNAA